MTDLIVDAANVLVPIAAMGAGATIQAAASEAGKDLHAFAKGILAKLRRHSPKRIPVEESPGAITAMVEVLDVAISEDILSEDDLRRLVKLAHEAVPNAGARLTATKVRNAFVGNTFSGPVKIT